MSEDQNSTIYFSDKVCRRLKIKTGSVDAEQYHEFKHRLQADRLASLGVWGLIMGFTSINPVIGATCLTAFAIRAVNSQMMHQQVKQFRTTDDYRLAKVILESGLATSENFPQKPKRKWLTPQAAKAG